MFDAHNHLDLSPDPVADWAAAREVGLTGALVAGVDPDGWGEQARLARAFPELRLAYGIHPWRAADLPLQVALTALEEAVTQGIDDQFPVALGELGLDRSRRVPPGSEAAQEQVFRAQLALARDHDLPVVLHIVRHHGRALSLLRADGLPAAGGMVHAFSGSLDMAQAYLNLGLYLSFSPLITRSSARKARAALVHTPAAWLLLETDAPDQHPHHRRPPGSPTHLPDVVAAAAALRDEAPATLASRCDGNARALFLRELPSG